MKIYLEFVEGTSSKFWSVEVNGSDHTVTYGRIGSDGRAKESSFDSAEDAIADAEKQAAKKRKKGYADAEASSASREEPAAKKKAKATKKKPTKKAEGEGKPKKAKKKKPPSARTLKSFFKAIREGNLKKVKSELERAIDANTVFDIQENGDPWSVLYYAVFHNEVDGANMLLDAGADASFSTAGGGPLHNVRDGELAKRLVDGGADPNLAPRGYAPLHRVGNAEVAQVLIEAGADIEAEAPNGLTPFESTFDIGIRRALLAAGAKGLRSEEGHPFEVKSEVIPFEKIDANRGALGSGPDGSFWAGSYSGFYHHTGETTTRYFSEHSPATVAIASAHGSVYFATNQGLLRFHGGEFTQYTPNNSGLHDAHLTSIAVIDDEVWCIGYESEAVSKHISVFDGTKWRLLSPGAEVPEKCDFEHIMRDAQGRLAMSDRDDGGVYLQEAGASEWIHDDFGVDVFTPTVYVMATREGVDYFGTHAGLWRRDKASTEKIRDGAFGELGWVGDTLWAATNWDGLVSIRGDEVEVYDEERAGHSLGNVESMVVYDGTIFLLTGRSLLRIDDGVFSKVGE